MTDERHDEPNVPAAASSAKQPYTRPQLIDYGTVAELTRGASGTRSDNHPGGKKSFTQP
jgi:hypothetical protein